MGNKKLSKKKAAQAETRSLVLSQLLTPEAKERLNRVRLVKEEKAKQVEALILNMAKSGTISTKVDEEQLKSYLAQLDKGSSAQSTKIKFVRKKKVESDDDSDDVLKDL